MMLLFSVLKFQQVANYVFKATIKHTRLFSQVEVNQTMLCYGWYLDADLSTGGIDAIGI